ncbi:MAG TPA: hypothetical protein VGD77_14050 [Gemmatimonadaceae bacterium]
MNPLRQGQMTGLWSEMGQDAWAEALARYPAVVEAQGVKPLAALDAWTRDELPARIVGRPVPHVTLDELVRVTEWKMARGVWRARNLALVRGNDPALVERVSTDALSQVGDERAPIEVLAELAGVGPATASAIAAAAAPAIYPFFDELVAGQVPGLGKVAFTIPYYLRYAAALRERAGALGRRWTPVMVERALWAFAGGKAGRRGS